MNFVNALSTGEKVTASILNKIDVLKLITLILGGGRTVHYGVSTIGDNGS